MTALRQKIIDASESGNTEAVIQADKEYNRLLQEKNNSAKDIIKYKKDLIKVGISSEMLAEIQAEGFESSLLRLWTHPSGRAGERR